MATTERKAIESPCVDCSHTSGQPCHESWKVDHSDVGVVMWRHVTSGSMIVFRGSKQQFVAAYNSSSEQVFYRRYISLFKALDDIQRLMDGSIDRGLTEPLAER